MTGEEKWGGGSGKWGIGGRLGEVEIAERVGKEREKKRERARREGGREGEI